MRSLILWMTGLCLIATGFGCGGTRVLTAQELQKRNAPPEPAATAEPAEE